MGEIVASMKLENAGDRENASAGLCDDATVRRATVRGVVDTGAVLLMLPENVVSQLGLRTQRDAVVTYADERQETRPVAGPVAVHIDNRFMITECIVGPPLSEALIGQVVLEALDLVADCNRRTLGPRPESPDLPVLKMKWSPSPDKSIGTACGRRSSKLRRPSICSRLTRRGRKRYFRCRA